MPQTLAVILLATIAIPAAVAGFAESLRSRATAGVDFFNPVVGGGSWLDNAGGGLGEPLNVSSL